MSNGQWTFELSDGSVMRVHDDTRHAVLLVNDPEQPGRCVDVYEATIERSDGTTVDAQVLHTTLRFMQRHSCGQIKLVR